MTSEQPRFGSCVECGRPKQDRVNLPQPISDTSRSRDHAARAREIYDQQAKERKSLAGGDKKSEIPKSLSANLREAIPDAGRSSDKAGEAVGVGGRSVGFATRVLTQGAPELVEAVDKGLIPVSTAAEYTTLPEDDQKTLVENAKVKDIYTRQAKDRMSQGGGDKISDEARSGKANLPYPISDHGGRG